MAERLQTVIGHVTGSRTIQFEPVSGLQTVGGGDLQLTYNKPRLSLEQRQFYEENGYLVIKKLVAQKDLDRYRERFEKICKKEVKVPQLLIMRDVSISKSEFVPGEQAVTKIQDFMNDEVLFDYCCLPQVVDYVECFTGPNVMAMHTMLINKPPDPAMEPVNRQNGCLVVLPGSHKGELLEHGYPEWEGGVNKMYHGIKNYDPSYPRVHLEMEAGDTVFFHPILIHGSGTNKTKGFRKSISCHYATGNMEYIDVEKDHVQSTIADEVLDLAVKRTGLDRDQIRFADIWKFRSRLVKGEDCST
ncbi:phytanoyl-CoA dioxygenase, peroxisomal-like isoform X2 [Haliotis rubra]|uniref:phytanoyl-CoA dioxygenase, peroxisomal-like isoform X2 n=1 Tax=Haliotis rubra TaxID=36100 RepID=UPI001EE58759|nr:phytanoyl-CoA dioxygenase, peroxisomal-like isoform X2 [Haliotis rubra]